MPKKKKNNNDDAEDAEDVRKVTEDINSEEINVGEWTNFLAAQPRSQKKILGRITRKTGANLQVRPCAVRGVCPKTRAARNDMHLPPILGHVPSGSPYHHLLSLSLVLHPFDILCYFVFLLYFHPSTEAALVVSPFYRTRSPPLPLLPFLFSLLGLTRLKQRHFFFKKT